MRAFPTRWSAPGGLFPRLVRFAAASTLHSARTVSCASTRWTAPRCGDARHPPRHALPLRTVTVRGAPGGRDLPRAPGIRGTVRGDSVVVAECVKGKRRRSRRNS
ncbi:conserved hypothetical protein [Streptomyces sp. SPB78]|nr:conserved hypothetical protein [Streptomyces sp. SPB78]